MSSNLFEATKLWLVFSMSLGCWTFLQIVINRKLPKAIKFYIISILIITLGLPLYAYLYLSWQVNPESLLMFAQRKSWLLGPLLAAMANHVLLKRNFSRFTILGIIPFFLVMIYDLLHLTIIPYYIFTFLLFMQMAIYLTYTAKLIILNKSKIARLASSFQSSSYFWLLLLTATTSLLILFDASIFSGYLLGFYPSLVFLSAIGCFAALLINCIALFALLRTENSAEENTQALDKDSPAHEEHKPQLRSIELSPEAAHQLDLDLTKIIEQEQPHLDETISLPSLAKKLGVSTHQLSELLNVHKGIGFYEYLNQLRHTESLQLISNLHAELKMVDIAYRSGFNNINSFYKVFKDKTGMTPNQYRKNLLQASLTNHKQSA